MKPCYIGGRRRTPTLPFKTRRMRMTQLTFRLRFPRLILRLSASSSSLPYPSNRWRKAKRRLDVAALLLPPPRGFFSKFFFLLSTCFSNKKTLKILIKYRGRKLDTLSRVRPVIVYGDLIRSPAQSILLFKYF
jgi:hypothetical protein